MHQILNTLEGKIICVGMHKTGTTTMNSALTILGYRVRKDTARLLIPILKGDYRPVLGMLEEYDAAEDVPWFKIYKELDQRIPGSKFILTVRDEEKWFKSLARVGRLPMAHAEWIFGRGKGIVVDNKENAIDVYRRHNKEVKEYFKDRPDDLLIISFEAGDGWEKLCPFLGKEIPEQPFPHSNKTLEKRDFTALSFRLSRLRKTLKNRFKIWWISVQGLWPEG